MSEFLEDTLVVCPICDCEFTIMVDDYGVFSETCPNCVAPYGLAKKYMECRKALEDAKNK